MGNDNNKTLQWPSIALRVKCKLNMSNKAIMHGSCHLSNLPPHHLPRHCVAGWPLYVPETLHVTPCAALPPLRRSPLSSGLGLAASCQWTPKSDLVKPPYSVLYSLYWCLLQRTVFPICLFVDYKCLKGRTKIVLFNLYILSAGFSAYHLADEQLIYYVPEF